MSIDPNLYPDPFIYDHDEEDEVPWDCDLTFPLEGEDDGEPD